MRSLVILAVLILTATIQPGGTLLAADPPSPAAAMRKLLESGRVPEARLPTVVKMICERGNDDDLAFVLSELLKGKSWSDELQSNTLEWLATAAVQRKVIPTGDISGVSQLLESGSPAVQQRAVELTGIWKVPSAQTALMALAEKSTTPPALRKQAFEALATIDPAEAEKALTQLATSKSSFDTRSMGIEVLVALKPKAAAQAAAKLLSTATVDDSVTGILDAFLQLRDGAAILAAGIKEQRPSKDVAKVLLRHMYSIGRTDAVLNNVLLEIAEINQSPPLPTKEQLAAMVAKVAKSGDPARGEEVFRRPELSCLNCHSVSQGGGDIGPDLSAIGVSSPVEYLITSLLDPDLAIKEAFATKIIITVDGKVLQGIISSRTNDSLVLKDATGKLISVPIADIDEEVEGKSLMPKGLSNFMTEPEFIDLVAFLAALGKPGDYAIRSTQRMQRYRVLTNAPKSVRESIPNDEEFQKSVVGSSNWIPAYARVNGDLPLSAFLPKDGPKVVFLRGDISCLEGGDARIELKTAAKTTLWLDGKNLGDKSEVPITLTPGQHSIVIRVDLSESPAATVNLTVAKEPDSKAEFVVVDGR